MPWQTLSDVDLEVGSGPVVPVAVGMPAGLGANVIPELPGESGVPLFGDLEQGQMIVLTRVSLNLMGDN